MLTVVTGAPCSGKTSYVRERAEPGDIIIDFDAIAWALSGVDIRGDHQHPEPIRWVATNARRAAIREAVRQHHMGQTVWITQCRPTSTFTYPGADIVHLDVDREELYRRAEADKRPTEWAALIDDYFTSATTTSRQW